MHLKLIRLEWTKERSYQTHSHNIPFKMTGLVRSFFLRRNMSLSKIYCYIDSSSVQFSSVTQSCLTLCDPMDCNTPGLPVHHQLLEFTQTHVHWVSDANQPSHPLSSLSPPALNLCQHQGLFKWVGSSHQVAQVLEFQLQHQSFQWTPRTGLLQDGLVEVESWRISLRSDRQGSPAVMLGLDCTPSTILAAELRGCCGE